MAFAGIVDMTRRFRLDFTLDWEGYEDVSKSLILADLIDGEHLKDVSIIKFTELDES